MIALWDLKGCSRSFATDSNSAADVDKRFKASVTKRSIAASSSSRALVTVSKAARTEKMATFIDALGKRERAFVCCDGLTSSPKSLPKIPHHHLIPRGRERSPC